jgi:class 3 adenylate cyclase
MPKQDAPKSRLERILERSTQPILVLAGLAVVLYILELFRVVPRSLMTPFLWINFLIDFIFLIDLTTKCIVLGRGYLRSPWFFIDFISTLPIISSSLEILGAMGPQLQATRVARGARVARIARVARVARLAKVARVARLATAIRARHGLTFLKTDEADQPTPAFNRALFIGVPALLLAFVLASTYITKKEVNSLKTELTQRIQGAQSQDELNAIQQEYDVTTALNPLIETTEVRSPFNSDEMVAVSLSEAYAKADRLAGVMLLLVLLTIGMSVYISSALSKDRSIERERSILSQCFSPPIVQKFYSSPEVIERFFHHWMTVFFIDIRGFTSAFEKDAEDVEGLALKLRQVMDKARNEIVITHEGVIDKFMGDAVMGWVGGHFSIHWDLLADIRQQLRLDELELIEQDLKSIQREIRELKRSDHSPNKELPQLESSLQEARKQKSRLLAQQKEALKKDSSLELQHRQLTREYRRRVAKSAVSCCLRISQEVEKIEDPDAFHELKIGIGSGDVLVGNFGATDQIGFTVLGPTVNRSARLEPASAQSGCKILIDQTTYELLAEDEDLRFRRVPPFSVKGISETLITYEPFFAKRVSADFLEQFERGVQALEKGNNQEAINFFKQANTLFPGGDAASRLWWRECEQASEEGRTVGVKAMSK